MARLGMMMHYWDGQYDSYHVQAYYKDIGDRMVASDAADCKAHLDTALDYLGVNREGWHCGYVTHWGGVIERGLAERRGQHA